jgi:GH18 family chitinase
MIVHYCINVHTLGAFERFTGLKQQNPELKALLAIGGWNEGSTKYSQVLRRVIKCPAVVQND